MKELRVIQLEMTSKREEGEMRRRFEGKFFVCVCVCKLGSRSLQDSIRQVTLVVW